MSVTKKQYYVPAAYLRRFTQDNTKIFIWDKVTQKSYPNNVENVAQQRNFYNLSPEFYPTGENIPPFDALSVEEAMWFVEKNLPKTIEDVLQLCDGKKLDHDQRMEMSTLIGFQLMRTPIIRNSILEGNPKEILQMHVDSIIEAGLFNIPEGMSSEVDYREGMETIVHGLAILNPVFMSAVVPKFYRHRWIVGINETHIPIQTSDAPVVPYSMKDESPVEAPWDDNILFPLDPKHILILLRGRLNLKELAFDGSCRLLHENEVRLFNELQLESCYRQLFSSQAIQV